MDGTLWTWRARAGAAFVLCAAASGCGLDLPAPAPGQVEPSWGYNGEDTLVDIYGDNFYPQVEVDASRRKTAQVDRTFSVRLRGPTSAAEPTERAVPGVTLVDYHHLQATVQDGLDAGVYDLIVEGPTGAAGVLEGAFTVTDTRIERVDVSVDSVVFEVFDTALIELTLTDPAGERVLQPLDVVIAVTDDEGRPIDATLTPVGLGNASELGNSEVGLTGTLDKAGYGSVSLSVPTPGLVDVTVGPADPGSVIADSVVSLLWEPGSDLSLEIALPDDSGAFTVNAGETFPVTLTVRDQFGNVVDDIAEPVLLLDECQDWYDEVDVRGPTVVEATLTTATGTTGCKSNFIRAVAGISAVSAPIGVLPADASTFDVLVFVDTVVAGTTTNAVVIPLDAYANATTWSGDLKSIEVTDSVGGTTEAACTGEEDGVLCQVRPTVAAAEVELTVAADALSGNSNPFAVVPADVEGIDVVVAAAKVAAGDEVEVTVTLRDAYGNAVDGTDLTDDIALSDDLDDGDCALDAIVDGAPTFSCVFTTAVAENRVRALFTPLGADALSDPFEVTNAEIAVVEVLPASLEVQAGEVLDVLLLAYDAFGNPYLEQDDPRVDLSDTSGTLVAGTALLDAAGRASAEVSITQAGTSELIASRDGVELGRSAPLLVLAAAPDALRLTYGAPWAWVGLPIEVSVEAVDVYGNPADVSEPIEVRTLSGDAGPVDVDMVGGVAVAELAWPDTSWSEIVSATSDSGLTGTASYGIVVVDDCASGGPSLDMSFSGLDDAVACWIEATGSATVLATLTGTSGGAPVIWFGVSIDGERAAISPSSPVTAVTYEVGQFPIAGLVAQSDGCGVQADATAYIAPDDGQPVGPFSVSLDPGTVDIGLEDATVLVDDATDCAGDAASGGVVRVRADRANLTGATATGSGLQVTLDGAGSASLTLETGPVTTGGEATVWAWTDGWTATAAATATLEGDRRRVVVWEQDPEGDTEGLIDTIIIVYSEALWSASPAQYTITGPDTVTVASAVREDENRRVRLTLDTPIDAAAGVWTLTVRSDVRDLAGNRLSGDYSGLAVDYVGVFGDVPSTATPVDSCEPSTYRFRPDGDDGAGEEADDVTLTLTSAAAPGWWRVRVEDASGEVILRDRVEGTGSVATWTWYGRDITEKIVANGAYTIVVDADDGVGNRGGACSTVVTVDNVVGE